MLPLACMWRALGHALVSHGPASRLGAAVAADAIAVRGIKSSAKAKKKQYGTVREAYDALLQRARAAHSKQQHPERSSKHGQGGKRKRGSNRDAQHSYDRWADVRAHGSHGPASGFAADEFYNLFFASGRDSGDKHWRADKRRKRRAAKKQRQHSPGTRGAWGAAHVEWHEDEEPLSDSEEEFDRRVWGFASSRMEDWKWWTDEDERRWFEEAWQQKAGKAGWQQQQEQQQEQSNWHSYSSWWDNFQSGYKQHQQQQQRQQHERRSHAGTPHARSSAVLEHLRVLGLRHDAVLERPLLKSAFHKAAMAWHPDRHSDSAAKRAAEDQFKRAQEAYESLLLHATG